MVTFGVVPTDANTGYGYIKTSGVITDGVINVETFVEKPNLEAAQFYLKQGNYFWNSGMFMFKASVLIGEMSAYAPEIG